MGLSLANALLGTTGLSTGLGLSVGNGLSFSGFSSFTPASLFTGGVPGAWYDPPDLTTMFQDAAGTTPVTAVEQPVGLLLDKSQGLALGSELVTNGSFSSDTAWTKGAGWTISGGSANFTHTGINANLSQNLGITVGGRYEVTFTVTITSGSPTCSVYVGNQGDAGAATAVTTSGTYTARLLYSSGGAAITVRGSGVTGAAFSVDNISTKLLSGNHAAQSTSAARPVLSARVNLLTRTEEFNDAVWQKTVMTVVPNAATAPNGTLTADEVSNDGGSAPVSAYTIQNAPNTTGVLKLYAKQNTARYLILVRGAYGNGDFATFDLQAGVVSGAPTFAGSSASITSVGDGWYLCALNSAQSTTPINAFSVSGAASGTGVGTSGSIYIWGADLRVANDGVGLPVYQRVTTSTDYDTTGFPLYLRFDGTDDNMVTGTITPGIDKAQIFAGVRKLSDTATMLAELSTSIINTGTFYFVCGEDSGSRYSTTSRGSQSANPSQSAFWTSGGFAPDQAVLTGTHDIAGDLSTIRRNTVAGVDGTGDKGTGNFLAYPLYIGSRAGTSLRFNGRLYSFIVRFGANLDATTITNTETWVNGKTRAY